MLDSPRNYAFTREKRLKIIIFGLVGSQFFIIEFKLCFDQRCKSFYKGEMTENYLIQALGRAQFFIFKFEFLNLSYTSSPSTNVGYLVNFCQERNELHIKLKLGKKNMQIININIYAKFLRPCNCLRHKDTKRK